MLTLLRRDDLNSSMPGPNDEVYLPRLNNSASRLVSAGSSSSPLSAPNPMASMDAFLPLSTGWADSAQWSSSTFHSQPQSVSHVGTDTSFTTAQNSPWATQYMPSSDPYATPFDTSASASRRRRIPQSQPQAQPHFDPSPAQATPQDRRNVRRRLNPQLAALHDARRASAATSITSSLQLPPNPAAKRPQLPMAMPSTSPMSYASAPSQASTYGAHPHLSQMTGYSRYADQAITPIVPPSAMDLGHLDFGFGSASANAMQHQGWMNFPFDDASSVIPGGRGYLSGAELARMSGAGAGMGGHMTGGQFGF
jgi:hypothetical protein